MTPEEIEEKITAIMWGKKIVRLDGEIYILSTPSSEQKNFSDFLYNEAVRNYSESGDLQSSDDIIELARKQNIWTNKDDNYYFKFDEIVSQLEEVAEKSPKHKQNRIKKQISEAREKRKEIVRKYNSFVSNSIEQQALEDKIRFLIRHNVLRSDGSSLWESDRNFDKDDNYNLLSLLIGEYINWLYQPIESTVIREIARSSQWRIRWSFGKDNIESLFGCCIRDLSDVQFSLAYWSLVYDSVYNSMDCPPDNVIEDDDQLDKWLKKRQKKENNKKINRMLDEKEGKNGFYDSRGKFHSHGKRASDHEELGLMVNGYYREEDGVWVDYTPEEKRARLEQILGGNTQSAQGRLNMESEIIKKRGVVRDEELRKGINRFMR